MALGLKVACLVGCTLRGCHSHSIAGGSEHVQVQFPWRRPHIRQWLLAALIELGAAVVLGAVLTPGAMSAAPALTAPQRQWLAMADTSVPTRTVTCLGDSLTAGFPYEGSQYTYPARLSALLQSAYGAGSFKVINRGVFGYRADQVLDSMRAEHWMAQDNPAIVLLMVGGNDLLQEIIASGGNRDAVIANTTAEVQAIVDEVTGHVNPDGQRPQIIVSAFPPNRLAGVYGSQTVALYNQSLNQHLSGIDLWTWDNWSDLYDPALGMARAELMWVDSIHLNTQGYSVVAENWFDAIQQLTSLTRKVYLPLVLKN
jgi:lysophospholipase L1-like esterase